MGYERWANLAPEVSDLQSFGYAEVSKDGSELTIKLMNIDGSTMLSKVLTAEPQGDTSDSEVSDSAPAMHLFIGLFSTMLAVICSSMF